MSLASSRPNSATATAKINTSSSYDAQNTAQGSTPQSTNPLVRDARTRLKRQKAKRYGHIRPAAPTPGFVAASPVSERPTRPRIAIGKPVKNSVWKTPKPATAFAAEPDTSELMGHLESSRLMHVQAHAKYTANIAEELKKAIRYSTKCRDTEIRIPLDPAKLDRQAKRAASLAKSARLPHMFNVASSYMLWRNDWNNALAKDIKLLGQLRSLCEDMGLNDGGKDLKSMPLSDLLEVLRSEQYDMKTLGSLLKDGYSISVLAAGVRHGLHPTHLTLVTGSGILNHMEPLQKIRRFERLVQYAKALPAEKRTTFFRLAKQAFQERLTPDELRMLDGVGTAALEWVNRGGWLKDAAKRLPSYRAALPEMNPAAFTTVAAQALNCDLSPEHLPAMVMAGVPINARMKPSDYLTQRLQQAQKTEARPMGGGASGSELQLLTLTHADGSQEKLVIKRLTMTPIDVPYGHANSGIPFQFEDIAQKWVTEQDDRLSRASNPEEKAALQHALENALHKALQRGDTEFKLNRKGPFPAEDPSDPVVITFKADRLPNLYGRDLAMRELASMLGQSSTVAAMQTAVIDGVYYEVAAFNPDMHQEVVRPTSDATLKLDTPAARQALAAMTEQDLQKLATSRGFESAHRLDNNTGIRFVLTNADKAIGYLNRFDIDSEDVRQRYNEHQVRNFLGNEADDHPSNSTLGASWDHDGSFGTKTSTNNHDMPRLVSESTWKALQNPDWTRFEGLILPKEIDALKARHQAFLDSKPLVVQDGEWGSAEVAKAMDVDQLNTLLEAYDTEVKNATTPAERNSALDRLSDEILKLETPLAKHAGSWAALQRESQISGRPSAPFFDQVGWTRDIVAPGRPVKV